MSLSWTGANSSRQYAYQSRSSLPTKHSSSTVPANHTQTDNAESTQWSQWWRDYNDNLVDSKSDILIQICQCQCFTCHQNIIFCLANWRSKCFQSWKVPILWQASHKMVTIDISFVRKSAQTKFNDFPTVENHSKYWFKASQRNCVAAFCADKQV